MHMMDLTPPLTQTIRERQEAVKAVASLGHGSATYPHRTDSLSEQDSGPDETSCSSQDTAGGRPRITPDNQTRSSDTPHPKEKQKHHKKKCKNKTSSNNDLNHRQRCSRANPAVTRIGRNPLTASITGVWGHQGEDKWNVKHKRRVGA
ncbi:hypothetical protein NDU88_001938 [Pleurodeles waltl]|uniref:Uncharacterized protein n=1 Tax=Pleurodeles waltl TaxID=8319 RepID=A0AAV7LIX2_PLEWA|nr:hypothetical protein NDU88_001938 [Pleurodeles waltl]